MAGSSIEWNKDYQETVGRRDFLTDDIYVINAGSADPNVWTTSGQLPIGLSLLSLDV